jgi:hypothetical protein
MKIFDLLVLLQKSKKNFPTGCEKQNGTGGTQWRHSGPSGFTQVNFLNHHDHPGNHSSPSCFNPLIILDNPDSARKPFLIIQMHLGNHAQPSRPTKVTSRYHDPAIYNYSIVDHSGSYW